jgi:hypothetical protein
MTISGKDAIGWSSELHITHYLTTLNEWDAGYASFITYSKDTR